MEIKKCLARYVINLILDPISNNRMNRRSIADELYQIKK